MTWASPKHLASQCSKLSSEAFAPVGPGLSELPHQHLFFSFCQVASWFLTPVASFWQNTVNGPMVCDGISHLVCLDVQLCSEAVLPMAASSTLKSTHLLMHIYTDTVLLSEQIIYRDSRKQRHLAWTLKMDTANRKACLCLLVLAPLASTVRLS